MPPQQQEMVHPSSLLKSASSGEYSVGQFEPMDGIAQNNSSTDDASSSREEPCRSAEEWLSRANIPSSRCPLSGAMNRRESHEESPFQATTSNNNTHMRTSLRERLHARMKEAGKPDPLHAEATLRLLTKGLTNMSSPPPPPPPPPHPTPTSLTGRKSPRELDFCLAAPIAESSTATTTGSDAPPPPRVSARSRSPKIVTPPDANKKQKTNTSDAVARIMQALEENQASHGDDYYETSSQASLLRLSRQAKYGKQVDCKAPKENSIKLHIYDLMTTETYMQLGWGCEFPIGQCFNAVNDGLHALGTGAYHCGIEINGIEYAYGANNSEGTTGVFSCIPKHSPGYEYRTTLDFGSRPLVKRAWVRVAEKDKNTSVYREVVTYIDGRQVMKEMAKEYLGPDYDLLRRNCCTFARDASLRLGIREEEIPTWFMNLADAGAATQDVAVMTLRPITSMLSGIEDDDDSIVDRICCGEEEEESESGGFEVVANAKEGRSLHEMEINVVEALNEERSIEQREASFSEHGRMGGIEVRRTCSWT